LYFACDDREAAALLARLRRFDGGIECEDVCLKGDVADNAGDVGDLLGGIVDREDATCPAIAAAC